jgi:NADH-quinone oxidoreductase subunit G
MATIYVENRPYAVKEGQNLLHACLSLGFDIPYFCWHPAMHSVGACRLCAVKEFKDESDKKGRIVMSCTAPARDGTRISIDDPEARAFRKAVIEWLMVNHPHDCPVCDEGGECHLQDMTAMTEHVHREFRFRKRTHRSQHLGPFINHEMNRCIACYRCVRFYRDFAGGRDFDVFGAHHHVYFGRHQDGVLENEFSGNLVEVCPTGVFTDRTFKRHYARKWDLQTAPSICVHCGLGCNTIPAERYGTLRRIQSRYHGEVNGYFLCDRGRFGYEFVNSERRIRQPLRRPPGERGLKPVSREEALACAGELLRKGGALGIGSPRASLEANFALRALVGADHFYQGMAEQDCRLTETALEIMRAGPARVPTLQDVGRADAALVLGEDVTNFAPMLALGLRLNVLQGNMKTADALHIPVWDDLAVREAARDVRAMVFVCTPHATKLDEVSQATYRAAPDDLARLGFAVAHALDPKAPAVPGLPREARELAETIAGALDQAERPLVMSGTGCGSEAVVRAAASVARALCAEGRQAEICFAVPECNTLGLGLMGGGSLRDALKAAQAGLAQTVIVLENDLYRRADAATVEALLGGATHVVVLDHLTNATTAKAEVVLPAATYAEANGTLVNNEGRAQRFFKAFVPEGDVQESWRWLHDLGTSTGQAGAGWETFDDVMDAMAIAMPVFGEVPGIAPPAGYRAAGARIPRQPHRYSGRTAMTANVSVHEPRPPEDRDSALAFSMEGYAGQPPPSLIPRFWAPGWNSCQAINKFQIEVGGPLHGGDPGRRIVAEAQGRGPDGAGEPPAAFRARKDEWLVVPLQHIFGSEELSVLSPGVAELAPKPYLAVGRADAERLGMREGDGLEAGPPSAPRVVPVRILEGLPEGVAGFPQGLPGTEGIVPCGWWRLRPVGGTVTPARGTE